MDERKSPDLPWPLEVAAAATLMLVGGVIGMAVLEASGHILWRLEHGGTAGELAMLAVAGWPTFFMARAMAPSRASRWAARLAIGAIVVGSLAFIATPPPPDGLAVRLGPLANE